MCRRQFSFFFFFWAVILSFINLICVWKRLWFYASLDPSRDLFILLDISECLNRRHSNTDQWTEFDYDHPRVDFYVTKVLWNPIIWVTIFLLKWQICCLKSQLKFTTVIAKLIHGRKCKILTNKKKEKRILKVQYFNVFHNENSFIYFFQSYMK